MSTEKPLPWHEMPESARNAVLHAAQLSVDGFKGTLILQYGGDGGIGTVETRQVQRAKDLRRDAA